MRCRSSLSRVSAVCVRLLSVMSCAILETPMMSPAAECSGEMLTETSTLRPSSCTRTVSKLSINSPRRTRSRMLSVSSRRCGGTISEMCSPDRFVRGVAEQPLGGAVPAGDGAVERLGDDGVIGGFHHRAEQPFPHLVLVAGERGFAPHRPHQARHLRLQRDIVDQQHRQHEARRAKPVDAPDIEAEIEPRHVDDRRQRDVEQPGAEHHHQPDVDHRMRPAIPEHEQRREAEAPDRRTPRRSWSACSGPGSAASAAGRGRRWRAR